MVVDRVTGYDRADDAGNESVVLGLKRGDEGCRPMLGILKVDRRGRWKVRARVAASISPSDLVGHQDAVLGRTYVRSPGTRTRRRKDGDTASGRGQIDRLDTAEGHVRRKLRHHIGVVRVKCARGYLKRLGVIKPGKVIH